jgi:STE24 endopeptidase
MNEDKATRYHRLGRRAGILSTLCTCLILVGFLLFGASAGLRDWASGLAGRSAMLAVSLYILVLALLVDVATLPFGFYRGFLLERRYGLSTETPRHWLRDHAKAVLIGLLFAEAGGTFVYFTLHTWPVSWWVIAGIGYSLVTVVLVNLAPVVLLPLFFRFKPLQKETLRDRLTALASKAGTRIMGVYEWTLSDRTRKANAALAGLGNTRRILVSDTLLAEYSDDEIEVILAHELAHHVHRDIWTSVCFDIALTFGGLFAAHHLLQRAVPWFGFHGIGDPAGIPVLLLAAGTIGLCLKPLLNAISRSHERRADTYALEMTKNPSAFMTAMKRLGQQNLAEDNPSKLVQAFFYTHPPMKERLNAARQSIRST